MSSIRVARSSLGNAPNYTLAPGELFLDLLHGQLYWRDANNVVQVIPFTPAGLTALINSSVSNIVAGAPAALDTLKEIADAIGDDPNAYADLMASINTRLRFDQAQSLSSGQQTQGLTNLGAQPLLAYTPVQMGTGVGQSNNVIKIGWTPQGKLRATVDAIDLGDFWMTYNSSFSANASGFEILPNGHIRQWAQISFSGGQATWTFPSAFPNNVFGILCLPSPTSNPGNISWTAQSGTPSKSSVALYANGIRISDGTGFQYGQSAFVRAWGN